MSSHYRNDRTRRSGGIGAVNVSRKRNTESNVGETIWGPYFDESISFQVKCINFISFSFSPPKKHLLLSVLETWGRLPENCLQAPAAEESRGDIDIIV